MIKNVPTNDVEIRINAASAGYFFRIDRTPVEEFDACKAIVDQIKRHVDGVGWTHIQQKHIHETPDGSQFETLYEALEHLYDEDGCKPQFAVRYVRPSDKGVGTQSRPKSFEELIVTAYRNPYEFAVVRGELSPEQQKFLDRVLEAALPKEVPANAQ